METKPTTGAPTTSRLIRMPEVERLTGLRKSSIYTYIGSPAHAFPRPVQLGRRAVAWRESEVIAWIESRTHAKPQGGKHD